MNSKKVLVGRPRLSVDFGLILALREEQDLGWSRVAQEYMRRTGYFISKQTCKRRYLEAKAENACPSRDNRRIIGTKIEGGYYE